MSYESGIRRLTTSIRAYIENDQLKFEIYCPQCHSDKPYHPSAKQFWNIFPEHKYNSQYYKYNHHLFCRDCLQTIANRINAEHR